MADVTTKELKVRVTVDAQTGQLKVFEADQDKVSKAVDKATLAMARQEQKIQRQTNGLIKLGAATTGLNTALGGLPNILVEVADKFDDAGRAGVKYTSTLSGTISKLGAFGTAALVAGAALAGWKIGRWISDVTGLDNAIRRLTDSMLGFGSAADSAADAYAKALNRQAQANITNEKLNKEITQSNVAAQNEIQQAFLTTAQKLEQINGQMYEIMTRDQSKFTADENREMARRYDNLAKLSAQYQIQIKQDSIRTGEEQLREAQRQAQERIKIEQEAAAAIAAFQFKHHLDFLERQKDLAEKSADILRQQIAEEIRINNERKTAAENMNNAILDARLAEIEREKAALEELAEYERQLREREAAETIDMFRNMIGWLSQLGGAFGKVFSAAGGIFDSFINNLTKGWQGWVNIAIDSVGILIGLFKDLFSHDWVEDTANQVNRLIGGLQISAELMERIAETAERLGSSAKASLIHLPDIFAELGVNAENFFTMAQAVRDVFSGIEQGLLTIDEASKILDETIPALWDVAIQKGGAYRDRLQEIIALTEKFGVEVPALTRLLSEELDRLVGNVNKFAEEYKKLLDLFTKRATGRAGGDSELADAFLNEAELNRIRQGWEKLGAFVGATIAEMIEQGRTWGEIMQQLGPSIETLIDTAERFGFKAKGAFGELLKVLKMMQEAADDFQRLDLMGDILDSLALFGRLGPKYIGDFFGQVKRTFADLLGFVGRDWAPKLEEFLNKPFEEWTKQQQTAFQSIIPYLLQAADYYREMGLPLPPMLQQLLDIAKAQGFISDTVPKPDPFEKIATELEKLNLNLENTLLMLQQMAGLVIPITFDVGIEGEGAGFLQKGPSSFKGLVGMHRITADSELMIGHRGEAIVDKSTADRIEGGSKGGNTYIFQGYSETTMRLMIQDLERDGY